MNKRIINTIILILGIIILYCYCNEEKPTVPLIWTINSFYGYIYEPSRIYTITYYLNNDIYKENFDYYLEQHNNRKKIEVVNISLLGKNSIDKNTYYNVALDFQIIEPFPYEETTYLILENNKYRIKLNIGIFYTFYSKNPQYLSYSNLEASYSVNLDKLILKTEQNITNCYIGNNFITTITKIFDEYSIVVSLKEKLYIYKFFLEVNVDGQNYLIDCPRFKTSNLELKNYLSYLNEGIIDVANK